MTSSQSTPAVTASAAPDLYALVIDHQYDTDLSVHRTEEGARARLFTFVSDWWDQEMNATGEVPMPEQPDEAISAYFEGVEDEFYTIKPVTIED